MAKKSCSDANFLREWLNTIPYGDYNAVRSKIVSACGITSQVLRDWWNGRTRIPYLAKKEINRIALEVSSREIYDLAEECDDEVS